jgi:hypothetical protein
MKYSLLMMLGTFYATKKSEQAVSSVHAAAILTGCAWSTKDTLCVGPDGCFYAPKLVSISFADEKTITSMFTTAISTEFARVEHGRSSWRYHRSNATLYLRPSIECVRKMLKTVP